MSPKLFLLAALALVCNVAHAEVFSCVTADGRYIAGVSPPPECKDRDVRELNADGTVKSIIPAPLTSEQRRERDAADAKRKQEIQQKQQEIQQKQQEQERNDRLRLVYPDQPKQEHT